MPSGDCSGAPAANCFAPVPSAFARVTVPAKMSSQKSVGVPFCSGSSAPGIGSVGLVPGVPIVVSTDGGIIDGVEVDGVDVILDAGIIAVIAGVLELGVLFAVLDAGAIGVVAAGAPATPCATGGATAGPGAAPGPVVASEPHALRTSAA